MPGTGPDEGAAPFEMTPRSLVGVYDPAPFANPGSGVPSANVVIELSAGVTGFVVDVFAVRRSSVWKQVTPVALPTRNCSIDAHPGAALATSGSGASARTAASRFNALPCMENLLSS